MPVEYTGQSAVDQNFAPRLAVRETAQAIRAFGPKSETVAIGFDTIQDAWSQLVDQLQSVVNGEFDQLTITDGTTGEVIGRIGTFDGLSGGAFARLWVAPSDMSDPAGTSPFYVDGAGKLQFFLGGADDRAAFEVLDGGGNRVVWAGLSGGYYGIAAENIWIGPGADPTTAPFYSDGTAVVIGNNGYVVLLDGDGNENGWLGARTISSVDYAGGWAREWRIGGDDTASAVIVADVNGDVVFAGGDIYLGPGATGLGGRLFSYTGSTLTGWVGSGDIASPVAITSIVGGTVTTGAAHGLVVGNYAFLDGTTRPSHNNRIVQVASTPTATTYTVTGLTGSSTGGTSTKQQTGAWFQELRAGNSGPATANLIANSSGLSITDAEILIHGTNGGSNYIVRISPSEVTVTNTTANYVSTLYGGSISNENNALPGNSSYYGINEARLISGSAYLSIGCDGTNGPQITASSLDGTSRGSIDLESAIIDMYEYWVNGTQIIDSSRNALLASLVLDTPLDVLYGGTGANTESGARLSLDVYSKSEVDTAIASAAPSGVSGSISLGISVSPSFTTIQFKDWAGSNQSMSVVTGVSLITTSLGFTNGVRTS